MKLDSTRPWSTRPERTSAHRRSRNHESAGRQRGSPALAGVDGPPDAWADLSLDALRLYRRRLAEEEEKVSYWRRLVHARIDVLEAEAHHERPLRSTS